MFFIFVLPYLEAICIWGALVPVLCMHTNSRVPLDLGSSLSISDDLKMAHASGPGAGLDYAPPVPHARSSLPLSRYMGLAIR
jgi:hypothetical protein